MASPNRSETKRVKSIYWFCPAAHSTSARNVNHPPFILTSKTHASSVTSEGLPYASTLAYWSRWSFTQNLLPLLNEAARQGPNSISRVVSILSGTCEGPIDEEDIMMLQTARHTSMLAVRARATSLSTLTMEALSKQAPDVSFIHSYPGYVVTPIGNSMPGVLGVVVRCFNATLGRWIAVSSEETGERC